MRGASALDVAIQLRQWAVDERSFGQSIEYSGERPPGGRDVLALERILRGGIRPQHRGAAHGGCGSKRETQKMLAPSASRH